MTELGDNKDPWAVIDRWAEVNGLVRIEPDDSLPESTPVYTGPTLPDNAEREKSIHEQEVDAAHDALDALNVPRIRELGEEETLGHVQAIHDMRLHGRIRILRERLAELGLEHLFTEES